MDAATSDATSLDLDLSTDDGVTRIEQVSFEARMSAQTVYEMLRNVARDHGDRPGVSFQLTSGPEDPSVTFTWAEVLEQVHRCANALRAHGIGQGDVVAYLLPNLPETVFTLLGGMTAGIVAPINPLLEPQQIAAILRETGAKALVTLRAFPKTDLNKKAGLAVRYAPDCRTVIEVDMGRYLKPPKSWIARAISPRRTLPGSAQVLAYHRLMAEARGDALDFDPPRDAQDICAYFHTGGTTGRPKVAVHRHIGAVYNGWCTAVATYPYGRNLLCPLPLFHVFAAHPMLMSCIRAGNHFIMPTPAGYRGDGVIKNFWKLLERWEINYFCTVPTALSALMQVKVDADISRCSMAICGSASLPPELFKRFEQATGIHIAEGYGQTEATCLISVNPGDGKARIGSVGLRFPYSKVAIIDTAGDGAHLGVDEVGEICIRNPGVISGYLEDERNKTLYTEDGWLRSGDLGRTDADGYLWITGRAKDVIIRGGHNIDPGVIEDAITAHPDVAFVGAIGQPDSYAGEIPCAYVELIGGAEVKAEALRDFAAARVSERAAKPAYVEILDELPKTAVGKIHKPPLRAMAIARVYGKALRDAGIEAEIEVIEDPKLGQIALVSPEGEAGADRIEHVLGAFPRPWRFASEANGAG